MNIPRGLSALEAEAWARLASSVTPLAGRTHPIVASSKGKPDIEPEQGEVAIRVKKAAAQPARSTGGQGLDGQWERRLKSGTISPDFTLDLHGHTLDMAYSRLMHGMDQARSMHARVVLLIAGKERAADPADRSSKRGAIRAQVLDWLAASSHGSAIAAVRKAHRRHGGEGALYLVLRQHSQPDRNKPGQS